MTCLIELFGVHSNTWNHLTLLPELLEIELFLTFKLSIYAKLNCLK